MKFDHKLIKLIWSIHFNGDCAPANSNEENEIWPQIDQEDNFSEVIFQVAYSTDLQWSSTPILGYINYSRWMLYFC